MSANRDETKAIRRAAHNWQLLINSAHATDADRSEFKAWLNADSRHVAAYERAATVFSAVGSLSRNDLDPGLLRPSWEDRWRLLAGRVADVLRAKSCRSALGGMAVGAIAIAIVFASWQVILLKPVSGPLAARYATGIGETRTISLDDGTVVTLGAMTEVETVYSEASRSVRLIDGAAFFDVAREPARKFNVSAGALTATALGTEFDVRSNAGIFRVSVAEGNVEVSYPFSINNKPMSFLTRKNLSAGQQIAASNKDGLTSVSAINAAAVGEWRDGRLVYETATLAELVADANRYSATIVEIAEGSAFVSDLKISGAFNGHDIDAMLSALADIHPVEIDRSDPSVVRIRALDPQ